MRLRDMDGIKGNGRPDIFRIDWHVIKPDPDNDLRDLTTAENRAHIEWTKNSIELEGVKDPLTVRRGDNDEVFAVDGRVRLVSLAELEAEGRPVPEFILAVPEKERTTREQRIVNMLIQSTRRKNYDRFEVARGVQRLHDFCGLSPEMVAARMGWKSAGTVDNYLDALAMNVETQQIVNQGGASLTTALKVTKEHGAEAAPAILEAAKKKDAESRKPGQTPRATPRAVAKVTGNKSRAAKTTENLTTFVSVANRVYDAAKLAGGIDKIGPVKVAALLHDTVAALDQVMERKPSIESPKPAPFVAEVETSAEVLTESAADLSSGLPATSKTEQTFSPLSDETPPDPPPVHPQLQTAAAREFPASAFEKPRNGIEGLLLKFLNAELLDLAGMNSQLVKEHEEASSQGNATDEQYKLCVASDVIGALRFPDAWEGAKANSELAQVA